MKKLILTLFDLLETARYILFSNRIRLDRPLFIYPKELRPFLKKYGQHLKHFDFISENKEEQIAFLKDYRKYLELQRGVKAQYVESHPKHKSPSLILDNHCVFFKGKFPVYLSPQGYGRLSVNFELNL